MTSEQLKLLRDALVSTLAAAGHLSLPLGTLRNAAHLAGFAIQDAALEAHLDYLVGKGFAALSRDAISAGVRRWKLTAAGRDYAEAEGLA